MIRSAIAIVLGGIVLAASVGSAGAQTPTVKLMLDFAIQGQQSPFVLAAEGGHFARAGVNVQVDRGYGSADAIIKVASGAYDLAFADVGALLQFNGSQASVKLVDVLQIYDVAPMVILSLKQSSIRSPADLKGKRLAAPSGSASRTMFPVFARANGLDPASVNWLDVTPQLREVLLVQRQADATTAFITDVPGLERLGVGDNDVSIMRYSDFRRASLRQLHRHHAGIHRQPCRHPAKGDQRRRPSVEARDCRSRPRHCGDQETRSADR